jgi:hypothetical protein
MENGSLLLVYEVKIVLELSESPLSFKYHKMTD